MAHDLIGAELPTDPECRVCEKRIDTDDGLYVDAVDGDVRPVCERHATDGSVGVLVDRQSRPTDEEEWDEWLVVTSVTG